MIIEEPRSHDNILSFEFSGLVREIDYQEFVPRIDAILAAGEKVRLLIHFRDFEGWSSNAFWRDLRFTVKHKESIERFAVVGAAVWEKLLIELAAPLTNAKVKYFGEGHIDEAWAWLEQP